MQSHSPRRSAAFALGEACAVTLVLALVVALGAIASDRSRALARCGEDLSHFREIGAATTSFGADNSDHVWQFSWTPSFHPTSFPDLQNPVDHLTATKYQLVDIIRTYGGRPDFPNMAGAGVIVDVAYAQAVLLRYLGAPLPSRLFTAAGDARTAWADDPAGYDQGLYTPNLGIGGDNQRQPYSASFRMGAAYFDQAAVGTRVEPGSQTNILMIYNGGLFGPHAWSEVAHPGQKAFLQDGIARYFGRAGWCTDPAAKHPVLMADGSASVRAMGEANRGANPNQPSSLGFPLQIYNPSPIEPPAPPGAIYYPGGPFWTRMNLAGRDFGGPDVFP